MASHAVIFINLGTPDSPETGDVRKYLREFLSDPFVIDINPLARWFLVNGIIAPIRGPRSAKAYKSIWTEEGSPLLVNSQKFVESVKPLMDRAGKDTYLCMRYGNPSMESVFKEVGSKSYNRVTLFPLYPQYALSSTQTVVSRARDLVSSLNAKTVEWAQPFYEEDFFIQPLGKIIKDHVAKHSFDHILYSYHGLPQRHITKIPGCEGCEFTSNCCDDPGTRLDKCYRAQCTRTTKRLRESSETENLPFTMCFQSRLGSGWLEPFTDHVIEDLPKKGVKKLAIVCPSFVADCLETLEEIEKEGRESFIAAGGEDLKLIPCLNFDPQWVAQLGGSIVNDGIQVMQQTF